MASPYKRFFASAAVLCAILALAGLPVARAQEAEQLDDLSLEALLSVEVVTASKSAESLSDAPGAISVITAKEIEQFGAHNLYEVLERLPGTFGLGYSNFPYGILTVRGVAMSESSTRVLVLLDGRPMRESTHGAQNSVLYTAFPLDAIERIEMIRGPGSVLYGTNAYAGVINLITKQGEGTAFGAAARYGSFDATSVTAHAGYRHDDLSVYGSVQRTREGNVQEVGQGFNMGEDLVGANLSARYKGLALTTFAGLNALARYGANVDPLDSRYLMADLSYARPVTAWWDASVSATYNYAHNEFGAEEEAKDYVVEATNHLRPFEGASLVVGGLAYGLSGWGTRGGVIQLADYTETRWSAYSQFEAQVIGPVKVIAGGQVNKVEGVALDFVPRLGAIIKATPALGAKLLYGQAFRSPFAVERSIKTVSGLYGNPALTPEKVATFDAQLFYNVPRLQLAATYFRSQQSDLIAMIRRDDGSRTFVNRDKLSMTGVELESKLQPVDGFYLTGSFVYQVTQDTEGARLQSPVPSTVAKVGASYAASSGVTVALFNTFFSEPYYDFKPDAVTGAFNYLTAHLVLDVTKVMHLTRFPAIQLDFYGTNLLAEEIYIPEMFMAGATVPRQTGRSFSGAMRVQF